MFSTYANAPAMGEGAGVLLGSRNAETPTETQLQAQVLARRLGLPDSVASLVLSLLRGEPHRNG